MNRKARAIWNFTVRSFSTEPTRRGNSDSKPRGLERRVGVPERDRTSQRPRTRPNGVPVVAALHDPLAIFLADNFSDVVAPDDNGADRRTAGVGSIMRP